jgi:hypothetical protein
MQGHIRAPMPQEAGQSPLRVQTRHGDEPPPRTAGDSADVFDLIQRVQDLPEGLRLAIGIPLQNLWVLVVLPLLCYGAARIILTIPAAGSAPPALRRPPCWSQPPRLRGQSQVLQDGAHTLAGRHVCRHLASASTARARKHVQRERPAQQPGPSKPRLASLLRLLHPPRQRRRAHSLLPRLYTRLREQKWPEFRSRRLLVGTHGTSPSPLSKCRAWKSYGTCARPRRSALARSSERRVRLPPLPSRATRRFQGASL